MSDTQKIKTMIEGGKKLHEIKLKLLDQIKEGISAYEIEEMATRLINKSGGTPSFKMVPNYHYSTCININDGIVHGIPKREIIFKFNDIVSLDIGLYYKGFHTDTSSSKLIGNDQKLAEFLKAGKKALENAVTQAKVGNRIYHISQAIENTIKGFGLNPVQALVGHGVGIKLHMEPQIPCFVVGDLKNSPLIVEGMTLAIEVMYTLGRPELITDIDGWTIKTEDGKIAGLFEDTVAVLADGAKVLT